MYLAIYLCATGCRYPPLLSPFIPSGGRPFQRYVGSMGINQGNSLITEMNNLRVRVWKQPGLNYIRINADIDTALETVYGNKQGGSQGRNSNIVKLKKQLPTIVPGIKNLS